jgi:DNA repair protein RecO (recombination protein O)
MAPVTTRALVLKAFPYGESSRILRLLTPDYGMRSAIAKGATGPRSRFGAALEPFTEGEAVLHLREGRDLHTLSSFEVLRSRQALGRDLTAFAGASLLAELLLISATEELDPDLFDAISRHLDRLASAPPESVEGEVFAAVWWLVTSIGLRPQTAACVGCGRALSPDESCRMDVEGGGAACIDCRPRGRPVPPAARAELAEYCDGLAAATQHIGLHRALLRAYLRPHFEQERPLRSLALLPA